jgi:CHASE2 domain-containing sensor protein
MTAPSNSRRGGGARAFLIHLARALPIIVAASLCTWVAHKGGWLDSFENTALDLYFSAKTPRDARHVVLVTITDDDYQNLFSAHSPLRPSMLKLIIDAILAGEPAVVGVDVLTADVDPALFEDLRKRQVIWAQDARPESGPTGHAQPQRWRLERVLGRDALAPGIKTGLAVFPRDRDGLIRRSFREFESQVENGSIVRPTLAWALVREYCRSVGGAPGCKSDTTEEGAHKGDALWMNFAGDRYSFRKIAAGAVYDSWTKHQEAPSRDFKGAIVILGGTFAAARDSYRTPVGELAGVELMAFAVESELEARGIRQSNAALMLSAEFVISILLVALNWMLPPGSRWQWAISGTGVAVLAIAASYVVFNALGYWASFVPLLVGVWLHQLYDRTHESAKARVDLEAYKERYGPL